MSNSVSALVIVCLAPEEGAADLGHVYINLQRRNDLSKNDNPLFRQSQLL